MLIHNPSTSMQSYHFIYNERLATAIMPCFIPECTVNDKLNLQTGAVFVCSNKLKFNPRVIAISFQKKLPKFMICIIFVYKTRFFPFNLPKYCLMNTAGINTGGFIIYVYPLKWFQRQLKLTMQIFPKPIMVQKTGSHYI